MASCCSSDQLPKSVRATLLQLCYIAHTLRIVPLAVMQWYSKHPIEPPHEKTYKMACAPSKDSDHPGHPPSLIRVFAVRMKRP